MISTSVYSLFEGWNGTGFVNDARKLAIEKLTGVLSHGDNPIQLDVPPQIHLLKQMNEIFGTDISTSDG
jgi:hypothetical protein